jgi:hypothetical protein
MYKQIAGLIPSARHQGSEGVRKSPHSLSDWQVSKIRPEIQRSEFRRQLRGFRPAFWGPISRCSVQGSSRTANPIGVTAILQMPCPMSLGREFTGLQACLHSFADCFPEALSAPRCSACNSQTHNQVGGTGIVQSIPWLLYAGCTKIEARSSCVYPFTNIGML